MRDTTDMAREAGFQAMRGHGLLPHVPEDILIANVRVTEEVKRLVALVRADEREACAKVCESEAEMFKSCAEGANDGRYDWKEDGARDCAYAIRARGETK